MEGDDVYTEMLRFIKRIQKSKDVSDEIRVSATRLLARLQFWHCIPCDAKVAKHNRCSMCGDWERNK